MSVARQQEQWKITIIIGVGTTKHYVSAVRRKYTILCLAGFARDNGLAMYQITTYWICISLGKGSRASYRTSRNSYTTTHECAWLDYDRRRRQPPSNGAIRRLVLLAFNLYSFTSRWSEKKNKSRYCSKINNYALEHRAHCAITTVLVYLCGAFAVDPPIELLL